MKLLSIFRSTNFLTRDEADEHFHNTMARTVVRCCGEESDGFHCTLFKGHSDAHEAWGIGRVKLEHSWPNINQVYRH